MLVYNKHPNNIKSVGKGFDRIAFFYDQMASIASFNHINKSQLAFIAHLSTQSTCLILGGGTGYFLQKLLEVNKSIQITYVDASEKMIEYSKERILKNLPTDLHRVEFVCAAVEDFGFETYDVIVCNYFFDLFEENVVQGLLKQCYAALSDNGILYVTDFVLHTNWSMKSYISKISLWLLFHFFSWATYLQTKELVDMERVILLNKFERIMQKKFFGGMLQSTVFKKIV
jgi:tRNA (cmo5U34)-methyltransferase